MPRIVGLIWSWVLRWLIIPLLYVLLIIAAVTAVCLVWRHLGLLTAVTCPDCVRSYTDWIAGKLGTDVAKLEKDGKFAPVVSDILVLLAFVVSIVPLLQAWRYRQKLRKELRSAHGLEVFKVKKEKIDDLARMLEFYKGAEHITVFCGDYDWLQPTNLKKNEKYSESSRRQQGKMMKMAKKMRDFVKKYCSQEKMTLVSSKSKELVKDGLKNGSSHSLFNALEKRFVFEKDIGIKCSLIEKVNQKYSFLYRSYAGGKKKLFNAHIFYKAEESGELINILRRLIEFSNWRDKAGEHLKASK